MGIGREGGGGGGGGGGGDYSKCLGLRAILKTEEPGNESPCSCLKVVVFTLPTEAELVEVQQSRKGGDRLSALHYRLQQEAEKIRKWKNATEVEIKQKVCTYGAVCTYVCTCDLETGT